MTITIKDGNLLHASENIIAHQVNGLGVMGGGIAKQIKKAYPKVYKTYRQFAKHYNHPEALLGMNLMVTTDGKDALDADWSNPNIKLISNLFGQARIGTDKKHTDEEALRVALQQLYVYAKSHELSVALPYGIGCGLGGGDWDDVYTIIQDVFHDYPVTLYRYNPRQNSLLHKTRGGQPNN